MTKIYDIAMTEATINVKLNVLDMTESVAPDCLHTRCMRQMADEIAFPLSIIFN